MHRNPGTRKRSTEGGLTYRKPAGPMRLVVAVLAMMVVLMPAGAAPAAAGPPSAAPPAAVAADAFMVWSPWNSQICLDQHLAADSSGQPTVPTTTVWLYTCDSSKGNQYWYKEFLGGNTFKVRNWLTGWCLSAPENSGSKVFTEVCVSGVRKQVWGSSVTVHPYVTLAVQRPDASCMYIETVRQLKVVPNKWDCRGDLPSYTWYMSS
jgi:hypothetical protein